jgi:sugar lactone lactonase YvrE
MALAATLLGAAGPGLAQPRIDVVVTGLPRPVQLAWGLAGSLVVLSHGWAGNSAGEVYHLDIGGAVPVDASRAARLVIPFSEEPRKNAFGSLAVDARGVIYLGEENGNRVYRVGLDRRVTVAVTGLNHLVGGGGLVLDRDGQLLLLDFVSPETQLRSESPLPPSLQFLADGDYQGPVVFRLDPGGAGTAPRRVDLHTPIVPRRLRPSIGIEPTARLMGVTVAPDGTAIFITSQGELLRLGEDNELRSFARLPSGHFHRPNLAVASDGSLYVSSGFQIRKLYRVSPAGAVTVVASELADPAGLAIDAAGRIYVAESALHRIIRITPR